MFGGIVTNRGYAPTFRNIMIEIRGESDRFPTFIASYEGLPVYDEHELARQFATALQIRIRQWLNRFPNHRGRGMISIRNPGMGMYDAYGNDGGTQQILVRYTEITEAKLYAMLENILLSNSEATFNNLIVEFNIFDDEERRVYGARRGDILISDDSFKSMFIPETIVLFYF